MRVLGAVVETSMIQSSTQMLARVWRIPDMEGALISFALLESVWVVCCLHNVHLLTPCGWLPGMIEPGDLANGIYGRLVVKGKLTENRPWKLVITEHCERFLCNLWRTATVPCFSQREQSTCATAGRNNNSVFCHQQKLLTWKCNSWLNRLVWVSIDRVVRCSRY